jgi:ArsR family transcriptional regulator, arsenate/arsenite/antimonite-responsive transcriptional repressor
MVEPTRIRHAVGRSDMIRTPRLVSSHVDHKTSFMVVMLTRMDYVTGMDIDTAARRLAELGNPIRLQIVRLLVRAGREGLAIGELQSRLGVPASTLAFHLRGLVTAGLVDQRKEGRVVRCTPNQTAINEALAFVKENCCAGFAADPPPLRSRAVG